MKNILILLLAIFAISCVSSDKKTSTNYLTLEGFAEGTTYKIIYEDSLKRDITPELTEFFINFENSLSIYNPISLISKLNSGDTTQILNPWFIECFSITREVHNKSRGLLDPTLRPLIASYGFGGKESLKSITQQQIDSMLSFVGLDKITVSGNKLVKTDPRVELDFNAIAKGYSVDMIGKIIDSMGVKNYLIEVGGEIFCKGVNSKGTPWNISIDTPFEGNYAPGADSKAILSISDLGMATSGNYRKFTLNENGEKVVHTIDPRTGRPSIHNLLSATIIAPTCAQADGFATACMVAGLEEAKRIVSENPQLEALFIYSEGDEMKIFASEKMQQRIKN